MYLIDALGALLLENGIDRPLTNVQMPSIGSGADLMQER